MFNRIRKDERKKSTDSSSSIDVSIPIVRPSYSASPSRSRDDDDILFSDNASSEDGMSTDMDSELKDNIYYSVLGGILNSPKKSESVSGDARNARDTKSPKVRIDSPNAPVAISNPKIEQIHSPKVVKLNSPNIEKIPSPKVPKINSPSIEKIHSPKAVATNSLNIGAHSPKSEKINSPKLNSPNIKNPSTGLAKSPIIHVHKKPSRPIIAAEKPIQPVSRAIEKPIQPVEPVASKPVKWTPKLDLSKIRSTSEEVPATILDEPVKQNAFNKRSKPAKVTLKKPAVKVMIDRTGDEDYIVTRTTALGYQEVPKDAIDTIKAGDQFRYINAEGVMMNGGIVLDIVYDDAEKDFMIQLQGMLAGKFTWGIVWSDVQRAWVKDNSHILKLYEDFLNLVFNDQFKQFKENPAKYKKEYLAKKASKKA